MLIRFFHVVVASMEKDSHLVAKEVEHSRLLHLNATKASN